MTQQNVSRRLPVVVFVACLLALVAVAAALVWVPRTAAASLDTPRVSAPTVSAPRVGTPPAGRHASDAWRAANLDVLDLLATLPVKGKAAKTGYSRAQFQSGGAAWGDPDHNRCDTRNDILRRDLDPDTPVPGSVCLVATGTLADPYTGKTIAFVRGPNSAAVQIDHVVALGNAWVTGAQQLPQPARIALANDPLNLRAVDGPTNGAKGDRDASGWLPPRSAGRCDYVARQVAVKARYSLWVTAAERDAMARVLGGCPDQGLPDGYQK